MRNVARQCVYTYVHHVSTKSCAAEIMSSELRMCAALEEESVRKGSSADCVFE